MERTKTKIQMSNKIYYNIIHESMTNLSHNLYISGHVPQTLYTDHVNGQ